MKSSYLVRYFSEGGEMQVVKRNGSVVSFDPDRILRAMESAFRASGQPTGDIVSRLHAEIVVDLEAGTESPTVEAIQDLVERTLVRHGLYEVSKRYILYREERARHREHRRQETVRRASDGQVRVIKRDGRSDAFDFDKLLDTIERNAKDIRGDISIDLILKELGRTIYDEIPTTELERALGLAASSFCELDPAYDKLTSRLYRQRLYRTILGKCGSHAEFVDSYRHAFRRGLAQGIEAGTFADTLMDYDLGRLEQSLDPERDDLLTYVGVQTLEDRYFVRVDDVPVETPQAFWMRVAMGLAVNEDDPTSRAIEFYHLMSQLRFVPSTPTLFHAGLSHPQLSSCYVSMVTDDLAHIFKCIGDNAQMSKWSGGIGNDWTAVRATGATIHSTRVESQGVIPFLKIANDTTVAINRSGKRRGATCAYLETWHLDIEDFLDLRRNTGDERRRTHDMNTANWIPDLFMKRVKESATWTLFSPDEVPDLHDLYGRAFEERYLHYEREARAGRMSRHKEVDAVKIWRKMLTRLYETGHPWITFKDPSNVRSPQDHTGVVHNSNLCTEITLNNSVDETAVCNLGSVNLAVHTSSAGIDHEMLAGTVHTAMRMLDNVIDINFYPTPEARNSNLRHRPVGLGVMGFQDALFRLRIPFSSPEAIRFADRSMEQISYHAILGSSALAEERGTYQSYPGSKWDRGIMPFDTIDLLEQERGVPVDVSREATLDWNALRARVAQHGMRNSNTMAVAPTATISNIAGCFPCIEPIYKNLYVKSNMSGEFTVVNRYLVEELKRLGVWDDDLREQLKYHDGSLAGIDRIPAELRELYKEAFEIDPVHLVRVTAARAKWIDQSQSHNVFMRGSSGKQLHDIYMTAWETGLKTTYYLRTLAASQIEKSTLDAKKYGYTQKRDGSQAAATAGATVTGTAPGSDTDSASYVTTESDGVDIGTIPATQVGAACSVLDPECESCQ